jgi:hypothetical protein
LLDDLFGVLLGELLVFVVALDGLLDLGDFVLGQVATLIFAVFPGVEVVVGAVGSVAEDGDRAVLHAVDLEDLFEEGPWSERCIHESNIDSTIYTATKK